MAEGYGTPHSGLTIYDASRHRPIRRRLFAVGMILAIALAGALIGGLTQKHDAARAIPPGPFSYFPV